jgi:alpha-beta hydrolase superfamily lysophospholipase
LAVVGRIVGMQPHLTRSVSGHTPRGLVLMLHGGAETNLEPVDRRSLPWVRSRLMMVQLRRAFHAAGLDVWLLRYRVVGWNHGQAEHPSPVQDARWALDEVRAAHGSLPVVLLGHSMGARTAVTVADDRSVHGVVGVAPWFPPDHPVEPLSGRHLVAAHGRADRVTNFGATKHFVSRAGSVAASTEFIDMGDRDHYMLKGLREWNQVARDRVITLFDEPAAR